MNDEPVTIPRALFESLLEYAMDLRSEWDWKKTEPRPGYADQFAHLEQMINEGVEIRDAMDSTEDR